MSIQPIHPDARIGHVHLKVSDVARSEAWYRDVLGFETTTTYGSDAVFMSAGSYHHHIALNSWYSKGATPGPQDRPGLFHFAILYPDRASLGTALKRLHDQGVQLDGAADHGVSEALYLHDPDGNGIELYRDRDPSDWPRDAAGQITMTTEPLDLSALLADAQDQ